MAGVVYSIPIALQQACMVRMARAESIADRSAAWSVTASSILLALAAGGLVCLMFVWGAGPLAASLFDDWPAGQAAAALALGLLVLLGHIELIGNPGIAVAGLLLGRKDTRAPMAHVLFGHWLVGAPVGLALCEI
jgi:MATE family multidrug resistance protein